MSEPIVYMPPIGGGPVPSKGGQSLRLVHQLVRIIVRDEYELTGLGQDQRFSAWMPLRANSRSSAFSTIRRAAFEASGTASSSTGRS